LPTPLVGSHYVEPEASKVLRVFLAPVVQASQQVGVGGAMVKLQQPGGSLAVAVLSIEHRAQGSDGTLTGGDGHRVGCELIQCSMDRGPVWPPGQISGDH